jgi:hypothetical protein
MRQFVVRMARLTQMLVMPSVPMLSSLIKVNASNFAHAPSFLRLFAVRMARLTEMLVVPSAQR